MKNALGIVLFITGVVISVTAIAFAAWLTVIYLLYGGIMQAVTNWQVDTALVVKGIIKAVFFQLGVIPGYLDFMLGCVITGIGTTILK